jgi:hypothetical protein
VSGHGFALQVGGAGPPVVPSGLPSASSRLLTWDPGTQTTSLLVRWWAEGTSFSFLPLPADPPLPPGVDRLRDDASLVDHHHYCYVLVAYLGDLTEPLVQGVSDLLCLQAGIGTGTTPPGQFQIRLDELGHVRLSWSPPGGQTGYILTAGPFGTSQPQSIPLEGSATSFTEEIGAAMRCYQLTAFNGPTELGGTDKLCAVPGVAQFAAGGSGRVAGSMPQLLPRSLPATH